MAELATIVMLMKERVLEGGLIKVQQNSDPQDERPALRMRRKISIRLAVR